MKVQVLSRKLIKPCIPTPEFLRHYTISFIDELAPSINVLAVLYYSPGLIIQKLEESLAEILPHFYPVAGRYMKDDHSVDCSDQGAAFLEAQVDCQLLDIIGAGAKPEELNDLLPCQSFATEDATEPLLAIQVSKFKCDGIAISVSISHRIADASSLGMFISAWANACQGDNVEAISSRFNSPLFFPGKNFSAPDFGETGTRDLDVRIPVAKIVARRFVFDNKAILGLRAKMSEGKTGKQQPSRVQVVSALITKALASVDAQKTYGHSRNLLFAQLVSVRERTVPPVPKYCFGNLVAIAMTESTAAEVKNMGFKDFVRLLDDNVSKTVADCAKILSNGEDGHKILVDTIVGFNKKSVNSDLNVVLITDWSKLGFYEVDFGWGKPILASVADVPIKNLVTLLNSKESGGIEAWVHLDEKDMSYFEQDKDLKIFTTSLV
ncbi:pelargonidin 3-O-(6-caffeoylglucoside) 5-O-(6-O-malonylglucoside) 4'''-malonyltransferase-like [Olea europaea var. sylvestris]|uniref:pelargonidin 3-O-(6-caffeoylglucoside) 5-O-(6-O-malonylglucoside) 4'''-malonyltransferase-like n=1 Tax=Olea europaea var. sylvestris TaxID=158386 RepID=UPI000C1D4606|nr:pelargonidin 3-O-(6-caffeoylglucoside) 5-O-(6-O-malonylglucoside) 4'''-malonyltransferase-like [Olea europaea var. sylvestris]